MPYAPLQPLAHGAPLPADWLTWLSTPASLQVAGPRPDLIKGRLPTSPSPAMTPSAAAAGAATIVWSGELPVEPELAHRELSDLHDRLGQDGRLLMVLPLRTLAVAWPPAGLPATLAENGFVLTHAGIDDSFAETDRRAPGTGRSPSHPTLRARR